MTVGCATLLSTLAVCPKEAVAKRRQNAKIVIFIMILVRSRNSAKCMASAGSRGNRHTKSERLGFELGKSGGAIEKGFAHIWKTRKPHGFRGICALADADVWFSPPRCYEDMEKTTGSISGANRLLRSGTKIREKFESRSWKLIFSCWEDSRSFRCCMVRCRDRQTAKRETVCWIPLRQEL